MDASAVPHFRTGGPSAAAQTFGARGRQSRGDAATMVDVTAGQGGGAPSNKFPTLGEIGEKLRAIAKADSSRAPDVFMKVGDSHTVSKNLLYCFAGPAQPSYVLDLDGRDALLPSIEHFRKGKVATTTPFDRASLAASVASGPRGLDQAREQPAPGRPGPVQFPPSPCRDKLLA